MIPIDLIEAIGEMDENFIRLCFDEPERPHISECQPICSDIQHSEPKAAAKRTEKKKIQQPKTASGSAFLAYLLTAGCTAACIAGFSVLIRMSDSKGTEYLRSNAPGTAITQLTQASESETTSEAIVQVTTAAEIVCTITEKPTSENTLSKRTISETERLITAETTALSAIEDVSEPIETKTVHASTVFETETTTLLTEPKVQKPDPADDLNEKIKRISRGKASGTLTLLDELNGEQYGWYTVYEGERSAIVYSETPEILDGAIAEDDALSHRTIVRTAYPEAGENCWKLSFISSHPNQLTDDMARCLLDIMENAQCGTLLDIIIEDFKLPMEFETGSAYYLPICLSESCEWGLLEEYADVIDLEHSIVIENFESKSLQDVLDFSVSLSQDDRDKKDCIVFLSIKDPNDHQQLFEIAKELEQRGDVKLFSNYFLKE